jgi:hypothetical protein
MMGRRKDSVVKLLSHCVKQKAKVLNLVWRMHIPGRRRLPEVITPEIVKKAIFLLAKNGVSSAIEIAKLINA